MRKTGHIPTLAEAIINTTKQIVNQGDTRHYPKIAALPNNIDPWSGRSIQPLMSRIAGYANSKETENTWNRVAQALPTTPGVNVTAPNFYTPFTTPSAFQIPNTRKEIYLWAEWFKDREPKVAAAIEFYQDFPFSQFEIECANTVVKKYFENLIKKLNFSKWLPLISYHYHLYGDCFIIASIDCDKCHGLNITDEGEQCDHAGASWKSISILDANNVEVSPAMHDLPPDYWLSVDDNMAKIVAEGPSNKYYNHIPDKIRKMILSKQPILIDPITIYHFKRGASANQPYGTSIIMRLFQTLAYKDKLRQAQWLIAERHILPIKIVNVGSDERPASDEDIEAVQEELTNVANDPLLTLVTHHQFKLDWYGANGKVLPLSNEFELIDQELLDGLMLNKVLLNGEGPTYSNAQVGLIAIERRLEKLRSEVAYWIEERLFKPVAEWQGFIIEGEGGEDEIIYPKIKWSNLQLRDDSAKMNIAMQLMQQGALSVQTMLQMLDIDYDQEIERLRFEQSATFLNTPGTEGIGAGCGAQGGMSGGFGAGIGGGFGGPIETPPLTGGEMPMPPAETPQMPPQPTNPPAAASIDVNNKNEMFKFASSIMNDVYNSTLNDPIAKRVFAKTNKNNQYKSAIHKQFVMSIHPPTGRGYGDMIDDNYNQYSFEELVGDNTFAIPMNEYAQREYSSRPKFVTAANKNKTQQIRTLFSQLEQKLYKIVLSLKIPYAFYAQYSAGPGMEYQLDGAFPSLKLGLEADSETFHNTPEMIQRDKIRDSNLAANGWTILRFTEQELENHPDKVGQVIMSVIRKLTVPAENHKL